MRKLFERVFLNEKFIFAIILLNAAVIFAEESDVESVVLNIIDIVCTFIFIIEMIVKHIHLGFRGYWKSGWNRLDGILVILSLPSVASLFFPHTGIDLSILMIFRLLRVLRFFRVMHFFPNFTQIIKNFKLAMKQSYAILLAFFVIIVIFGLVNCALFKEIAPDYFSTPLDSIYAVFQLFTVEGWYEIPNTIAEATSPTIGSLVKFYFCLLLILGGIVGMSFINSIFVDAMVSDNNDDVKEKLEELERKIDQLLEEKKELQK
ncbi:MAG: ion transporter [Bacteroidales bacterium]|nr:ion transporter [Bacteroidales bacterium]